MRAKTVSELTRYIKALLDEDQELADLWVEGELSNLTRASSGHCYFTLKDAESELRCVLWRGQANQLTWWPQQGDWVLAHGYVSVYERGGVYQFYADRLERGGIGDRWREFQALKERLQAEGLFDTARKRPLPPWPRRIGVVTSPTGAALRDILKVLRARYPLVEVVLAPSLVQGEEAPASLRQALARLCAQEDLDAIIIARGGGSVEDLWAFNDEGLARMVAACPVPVVSGVGHETDFTIVDFVADLRAPTPSAAAAAVVPDGAVLRANLAEAQRKLTDLMAQRLRRWRELLQEQKRRLRLRDPRRVLAEWRQRLDDALRRASLAMERGLALRRMALVNGQARLKSLHPYGVLARGYAVVRDRATGRHLASIAQLVCGQEIWLELRDGQAGAQIRETHRREQDQELGAR